MSIWLTHPGSTPPPPGTPELFIERIAEREHRVLADGVPVHSAPTYYDCHLWCQNTYRLTSTMMLPVTAAYEAAYPPPAENKYRKPKENARG